MRVVTLDTNVGIPAGRNIGAAEATGDIYVFLDDDAVVAPADSLHQHRFGDVVGRFEQDPALAVVGFRLVDPDTGATARRHVPRLGKTDPAASGPVAAFLGGACAIRATAFHEVGGLAGDFFYALEETDMAWRLIDAGWTLFYDADVVFLHPKTDPARHGSSIQLTSRNRVLAAKRCLPVPVGVLYVFNWLVITTLRGRSVAGLKDQLTGTRQAFSMHAERTPMSWRTIWKLIKLKRPPVI
jgi:GT2 family glycosyltransferase